MAIGGLGPGGLGFESGVPFPSQSFSFVGILSESKPSGPKPPIKHRLADSMATKLQWTPGTSAWQLLKLDKINHIRVVHIRNYHSQLRFPNHKFPV